MQSIKFLTFLLVCAMLNGCNAYIPENMNGHIWIYYNGKPVGLFRYDRSVFQQLEQYRDGDDLKFEIKAGSGITIQR